MYFGAPTQEDPSSPDCVLGFRGSLVAAGVLMFPLLSGCGGEASGSTADFEAPGPIRLSRLLADASIQSPVTGLRAAHGLEELGEVARTTLLDEDFDEFDASAASWRMAAGSALEEHRGGQAFVLRGLGRGGSYGWVFPVEPCTHYLFERGVCAEESLGADFAVVEATQRGSIGIRGPFDNHYMAGRGLALKVHWPASPEPDGSWQRGSTSFFTTPSTRAIAVILRPTVSQQVARGAPRDIWFDDMRLERIEPTPDQAISLVMARSPAPGADTELGIEKFGQFPPLGEVGDRHSGDDDNFSYRHALYAPPPTDLGFELRVPPSAILRFAVSLARETPPGDAVRFELVARMSAGSSTLWSRDVKAEGDDWRWHEERVDLGRFAGEDLVLELRTRALVGHPHPVWGHPVIDVPYTGEGPRNVILIAVDTLRADHMSCYGYAKETTPRLDALAADGVRFDQVASNANWTCPSFASIFTGVVPSRHGVFSYGPRSPLPDTLETLAERFQKAGWATEAIAYKPPLYDGGFEQGFDIALNVPREAVRGEDNLIEALAWLEANADRRNFLFLHFNDPHQPFTQPAPYDTLFGDDPAEHGIELPYSLYTSGYPATEAKRAVVRSLYDGEVAYVDNRIGAFLDALKARGLYEDAVIGFVADHGEQLWEHGGFGHGGNMLFDEVVRVPLIIKPGAGDFARGTMVESQVRGFDVMPTLLDLAGIPVGDDLDAESLVPLLGPSPVGSDRVAVTEITGRMIGLRSTGWKYLLSYGRRSRERLFDLTADPGEKLDIAAEQPAQVALLRAQTLEYLMLRRSGHYLVVLGEKTPGRRQLEVRGAASAETLFGLGARTGDGQTTFAGDSMGSLWLVARLEAPGPLAPTGADLPVHGPARYRAGDLDRLLSRGTPGFHIFTGPSSSAPRSKPRRTIDAQQLEALRAMGYAGDEDEDEEDDDGR